MACITKTPSKSLSPALLKIKPGREQFEQFKAKLSGLVGQINSSPNESEEHHKNHISDFLKYASKFPDYFINTNDRIDLVIHNGKLSTDKGELLRARDEAIFISKEKLLMRQTSDKLILAYDDEQHYTIDPLFLIHPDKINLKYLLALLNSKLLNRQYQRINPEQGRVFAQVKIDYVNELPIVVDENHIDVVVALVNQILALKKQKTSADTSFLEKEIDQLVYALYDLTPEEIAIVEGKAAQVSAVLDGVEGGGE